MMLNRTRDFQLSIEFDKLCDYCSSTVRELHLFSHDFNCTTLRFGIRCPSEDAKHGSHCSHSTLSGAVGTPVREIHLFSHHLNCSTLNGSSGARARTLNMLPTAATALSAAQLARDSYLNRYLAETLHLHGRYKQRQFRLWTNANLGQQKRICTCFPIAILSVSATCLMTTSISTHGICIINAILSSMF